MEKRRRARRFVSIQRISQAIFPALLGSAGIGKRSYVIKELEPTADRVNLTALGGKSAALNDVVQTMAETAAWAHLRGCGRFGTVSVEALAAFVRRDEWRRPLMRCADAAHLMVLEQWKHFSADYDADSDRLLPAGDSR